VVANAKCVDERGYHTFWMMATHLCGVMKNLRIGCGSPRISR
jgi:hypothetical protein